MDLSGKGYSPAHSFLQNTGSLVSAYGLGSQLVAGHSALTTSLFSASTSRPHAAPVYSGSMGSSSLSPSPNSYSNGHHIPPHRQSVEKAAAMAAAAAAAGSSADGSSKAQIYASPAPVFNRHKDSFPYGISGVPMPSYGYHGDVYQFTSNGYPRKSRTCSFCTKVFTRSTTRRYHEKRCPILRATVSSYMGEENPGSAPVTPTAGNIKPEHPMRGRVLELNTTHSYKTGPGQALGPQASGISRSNESQETATSMFVKSPPVGMDRQLGDESPQSGYQTSVIVKQEPHESETMATSTSNMSSQNKHLIQAQELVSDSVLRFSPESDSSTGNKSELNKLPSSFQAGFDLTKSPSHTSVRDENTSVLSEKYEQFKMRPDEGSEANLPRHIPPHLSLASQDLLMYHQRSRYNLNLSNNGMADDDEEDDRNDENGAMEEGSEPRDGDDSNITREDISDVESGEVMEGGAEPGAVEKKDGKIGGIHKCGICGKCFESSGKLHLHEQLHTKFKPYACKFCGQKFAKSSQRIEHEKTHNGLEAMTHICAVCGSSFTRKYTLKLHMRRWHQEGPWLCRHCGKASLTQLELKNHLYSHNLPRMERESLLYLQNSGHISSDDGEDAEAPQNALPPNYAGDAGEGAPPGGADETKADGAVALPPDDPTNKQEMEMCHECGRDFPKGYMRFHLKSHETQKPYSCPICGKRFGYKNNMKSHIKLHTGVKPFQCKMCGAKFTRGSTLRRHARRHGIIADSVWDLFIKPDYSKGGNRGGPQNAAGKLNTLSTSIAESKVTASNQMSIASGGLGAGDSTNYLASTLSPTPSHGSLYPLYASLGQIPPVPGLYQGLSATTSYLAQHLPHSSTYAASSHLHPQLDALNLSVQKAASQAASQAADHHSDQSSFSNMSAERSRSRSRSLSGSDSRRYLVPMHAEQMKPATAEAGVQVHTCCPPAQLKVASPPASETTTPTKPAPFERADTPPLPNQAESPSPLAVVPYIVTSPSQRPSNLDSTSPALSSASGKDYALETISSLIGSGRMFKCFHCECYFSEYAMYRIHAKLHNRDFMRPFVCMVCGEDCHDRVYFALHLSEHLR